MIKRQCRTVLMILKGLQIKVGDSVPSSATVPAAWKRPWITRQECSIDLKQILSRYEDADAIESFNAIVQQESAFQAALSVTGKVSQLSILDYI